MDDEVRVRVRVIPHCICCISRLRCGGATPSVRINSRGILTGCRSLPLSNQWAGLPSMADILIEENLRLLGHVHRMDNNRLPKKLLYFQLCLAMRNQ